MIFLDINDLFNILEEEKNSDKLTKLSTHFIDEVKEKIEELKELVINSKDLGQIKSNIEELDKIRRILLDIFEIRKEKIFNYLKIGEYDMENLLDFEEDLVLGIKKVFREYDDFIRSIFGEEKEEKEKKKRIRVLTALPRFLSANGEEYGPYDKNEIVELPEREANLLISKGMAEELNE